MTETDSKRLRVEAMLAGPPTKRCKELRAALEQAAVAFPDRVRLEVYFAGERSAVAPTKGFQNNVKHQAIPCAYVNGACVDAGDPPTAAKFEKAIGAALALDPAEWAG